MVTLGQIFFIDFITSNNSTGAAVDADTDPVVQIFEDDNDTPILTFHAAKRVSMTGNYKAQISATTANGFEVGKSYNAIASYEISTVATKIVLSSFYLHDTMMKLTDAALRVTTAIPDYFTPTGMAPAPVVVLSPQEIYYDNTSFMDKWDVDNGVWLDTTGVDPTIVTDVEAAQVAYDIYVLAKRDWDQEYNIQREVQWKALVGQKFIDGTE